MQILIEGSNKLCDELLDINVGVFSIKIINEFMNKKSSSKTQITRLTKRASNPTRRASTRTRLKRHATI
jgi:hypothetical protein